MKQLTDSILDELSRAAQNSPRRRANHNLHEELNDPIQRLAIAMEPDTLVLPHRHPHTWELLHPVRGRFVVLHFDAAGTVIDRTLLGEHAHLVENPAGVWHAVLSLDTGGIIFEVKHGPYMPLGEADVMQAHMDGVALNRWYASANIGDRLPYA
ncbi:MAG: WbuC family cupin fold metalloprotein [Sulfuricella denitrificans]|nr:WbuC family cupin fold metalloprotein [Sulfuricella denitrificans]